MKKSLQNLIGVMITISLIIVGGSQINHLVRPTDTDGAFDQINTFHHLPDNSVDVIVFGSSHAFRGCNVIEMYDKYGIGGYNNAWHWQQISTTKLWIKEALSHQSPKIALIECCLADSVAEDTDITPQIYYNRYLDCEKKDYLKKCFGNNFERYLAYYIPLIQFHDNWIAIGQSSFSRLGPDRLGLFGSMGVDTWDNNTEEVSIPNQENVVQLSFSKSSIDELDEIVEMCQKNNVEIIFFVNPYAGEYQYADAMAAYANEKGYPFFNFFTLIDEVGIDPSNDFHDGGHLNLRGATKVADYLGAYINDNYSLMDMRTVPGNMWEGKTISY